MNCSRPAELAPRHEDALLLACASARSGGEQLETIRRLAGQCRDWDYILDAARRHGVTALVSSNLDVAAADIVPSQPLETLRSRFRANAARNLFLTQELLSLIRKFGAHGIKVIPFKGPLLAITAYGNIALREFQDLDVLVPKEHLNCARQLLLQWGYEQPVEQTQEQWFTRVESQLGCDFFRKDGRIIVEMHWSFIQRWLGFEMDMDALWKAPDHVRLGGMDVSSMPAETGLLYLCAHGAKHRWNRLMQVVDVAKQLRAQPGMDWDMLLKTAKRTGSRRTFFLGLYLARELLEAEVPQPVWRLVKSDGSADTLAREICGRLFASIAQQSSDRRGWANDWFYLRTKERWHDRFRYLQYSVKWLLLPSERDKQWVSLPDGLGWLYIFLRPIRAARDAVRPRSRN